MLVIFATYFRLVYYGTAHMPMVHLWSLMLTTRLHPVLIRSHGLLVEIGGLDRGSLAVEQRTRVDLTLAFLL